MSVIETLTADPHRECRDRADALTGMLATLYTLACVGDYQELVDFVTRRRLDDRAIGKLLDRVEAAEHAQAGPWHIGDPQTLAAMHCTVNTVIVDANHDAWQLLDDDYIDEAPVWRVAGSAQWWTTNDPVKFGPVFPVQIIHTPKETKK